MIDSDSNVVRLAPDRMIVALENITSMVNPKDGVIIWDAAFGGKVVSFNRNRVALRRTSGVVILDSADGTLVANLEPDYSQENCVIHDNVFIDDANIAHIIGDCHRRHTLFEVQFE